MTLPRLTLFELLAALVLAMGAIVLGVVLIHVLKLPRLDTALVGVLYGVVCGGLASYCLGRLDR